MPGLTVSVFKHFLNILLDCLAVAGHGEDGKGFLNLHAYVLHADQQKGYDSLRQASSCKKPMWHAHNI